MLYALRIFGLNLVEIQLQFQSQVTESKKTDEQLLILGLELHVISSGSKAVAAWLTRDAIQEARESCGGHGYLKGKYFVRQKWLW